MGPGVKNTFVLPKLCIRSLYLSSWRKLDSKQNITIFLDPGLRRDDSNIKQK
jgi:hypothetical protein